MEKQPKAQVERGGKHMLKKACTYTGFVCAQMVLFAALMLTNTGMGIHVITIVLVLLTYFIAALKNPGVYQAPSEPNLQDLSGSRKAQQNIQNLKKKGQLTQNMIAQSVKKSSVKSQSGRNQQVKSVPATPIHNNHLQSGGTLKHQKMSPAGSTMQRTQNLPRLTQEAGSSGSKQSQQQKRTIFRAARQAIGNFANIFSRKKKPQSQEQPEPQVFSPQSPQLDSAQKQSENGDRKVQPIQPHNNTQAFDDVQVANGSKSTQKDEDRIEMDDINRQFALQQQMQNQKNNQYTSKTLGQQMYQLRRYCRLCEFYQPLRARHCHSSDQCILTFDHYCPWLGTCVGQKNRPFFIFFLIAQSFQLFSILGDLFRHIYQPLESRTEIAILLTATIIVLSVVFSLTVFNIYLIGKGLTTWQYLRWQRIQYLNIFDHEQLTSPFDKGWRYNIWKCWQACRKAQPVNWQQEVPEQYTKYLLKQRRIVKIQTNKPNGPASDRPLFRSQKDF